MRAAALLASLALAVTAGCGDERSRGAEDRGADDRAERAATRTTPEPKPEARSGAATRESVVRALADLAGTLVAPPSERRPLAVLPGPSDASRIDPRYSRIATSLAGQRVEVRCWSETDWRVLVDELEEKTGEEVSVHDGGFVLVGDRAHLAPEVCALLDDLTYRKRRPSGNGAVLVAEAVVVLAHESAHSAGVLDERKAQCEAVQRARRVARALGAGREYTARLAELYWSEVYPELPADYRSPDCRDGGALDLRPESSVWP